ncbi:MAG: EmrB/QacA family drug resistance transporter, partial [Anaerolineae bacterium]|nr:EmrB/QacA family drug resistance transporter [Anaerolineae bacterium]NIN96104.1 EmrB/QacA family drug resistance transporter [Anaerolineae bacterium]NIQ77987.1 EmrB/QacA family drug resistance transporter [Anaerolineae bacterium]
GLGSCFVPLSAITLGVISREKMGMASGVFNLMRNIGGSVGIAIVTTLLSRRGQLHHHFLVSNLTPYN